MLMSFVGNMLPGVQSRKAALNVPVVHRSASGSACVHSGNPRCGAHHACSPQTVPSSHASRSPAGGHSARSAARSPTMAAPPEEQRAGAQLLETRGGVTVWGPARGKDGQRPSRILCYGDSNTAGYHSGGRDFQPYGQAMASELADLGVHCEVIVCGLCSYTTKEMLDEKSSDVVPCGIGPKGRGLARMMEEDGPFDLVIIMTGTNDMGMYTGTQTIVQHVAQLHAFCHERGVPTVAVAPTQGPGKKCRQVRQELADALAAWAGSAAGVLDFVDVEDLLPRPCGKNGRANIPAAVAHWERDDLHCSAAGSLALGRRMASRASSWLRGAAAGAASQSRRPGVGAKGAAPCRSVKVELATSPVAATPTPARSPGGCALAMGAAQSRRQQRARTLPAMAVLVA